MTELLGYRLQGDALTDDGGCFLQWRGGKDVTKVRARSFKSGSADVGDIVTGGQKLASIEAMKMENTISASQDGVVAEVCANEGDSLAVDQLILRFK